MVKAELLYGAWRSRHIEKNLLLLKQLFAPLQSLPFDDAVAEHYAQIRLGLATQGRLIGANDLLIAAIARTHNAILITHNTDEFSRVDGLRMEDWELPQ